MAYLDIAYKIVILILGGLLLIFGAVGLIKGWFKVFKKFGSLADKATLFIDQMFPELLSYLCQTERAPKDALKNWTTLISSANFQSSSPLKITSLTGLGASQFGNPIYFIPIEKVLGEATKLLMIKKVLTPIEKADLAKIITEAPGGKTLSPKIVDEIVRYSNKRELVDAAKQGELYASEVKPRAKIFEPYVKPTEKLQIGKPLSVGLKEQAGFIKLPKLPKPSEIIKLPKLPKSEVGLAKGVAALSGDTLKEFWGNGKPLKIGDKEFTVHKMSYGDYFLEPTDAPRLSETQGFAKGTIWLEKTDPQKNLYQAKETITDGHYAQELPPTTPQISVKPPQIEAIAPETGKVATPAKQGAETGAKKTTQLFRCQNKKYGQN